MKEFRKPYQSHNKALTLLELMVVVLILGVLAVVSVSAFQKYIKESKISEASIVLKSIYDSAMVQASKPEVTSNNHNNCLKRYRFGAMSYNYTSGHQPFNADPPNLGMKKSQYLIEYAGKWEFGSNPCYVQNFTNPTIYGLNSLEIANTRVLNQVTIFEHKMEPSYFAYFLLPDQALANELENSGININFYDGGSGHYTNTQFTVSSALAAADFNDNDELRNSDNASYANHIKAKNFFILARGMYIDYDTGEAKGLPAIERLNPLE